MPIRKIASSAVIAAAYAAVTMILAPLGYGPVQFRIAEALCILPYFFPFSVWGLCVGCLLANLMSVYGVLDVVFGTLATLLASLCTMYLGKSRGRKKLIVKTLACLPPVVFNSLIVGAVIAWSSAASSAFLPAFVANALQIALDEAVIMFIVGLPLLTFLPKMRWFQLLAAQYDGISRLP